MEIAFNMKEFPNGNKNYSTTTKKEGDINVKVELMITQWPWHIWGVVKVSPLPVTLDLELQIFGSQELSRVFRQSKIRTLITLREATLLRRQFPDSAEMCEGSLQFWERCSNVSDNMLLLNYWTWWKKNGNWELCVGLATLWENDWNRRALLLVQFGNLDSKCISHLRDQEWWQMPYSCQARSGIEKLRG